SRSCTSAMAALRATDPASGGQDTIPSHTRWYQQSPAPLGGGLVKAECLKRAVREQQSLFGANEVLIEDKASGTQLIQELIADGCHGVTRYQPTCDKIMRLNAQTAMIENGFVHIPETAPWLDEYLHELTVFPKGKHDDQVDSTAQFLDWFKKPFPGQGIFEFYRMRAERRQNPNNPERYRVRLRHASILRAWSSQHGSGTGRHRQTFRWCRPG